MYKLYKLTLSDVELTTEEILTTLPWRPSLIRLFATTWVTLIMALTFTSYCLFKNLIKTFYIILGYTTWSWYVMIPLTSQQPPL